MISKLAGSAIFTEDTIFVDVSNRFLFKQVAIAYECELAYWASLFGKKHTILRCTGTQKQLRIPASLNHSELEIMTQSQETIQIANMLWFGRVPVTPELFRLCADLIENPRSAGIVRIPDERQIIITNESGSSLKNATPEEAVTWSRSDYWHRADLAEFRQRCRQELSAGGESVIEHTYRAFDPTLGANNPTSGNWVRMTQSYRLFDGNDGNHYQICEILDMQELELQTM